MWASDACRGENGETWFAELKLLFRYRDKYGTEQPCAFVRWLAETRVLSSVQKAVRMTRLKYETVGHGRGVSPRYDIIQIDRVMKAVCLQPDPTAEGYFFHNRFVA